MTGDRRFDAVTFDFWHTLMTPVGGVFRERRLAALAEAGRGAGAELTDERVEAAFVAVFEEYQRAWEANRQYSAADAVAHLQGDLGIDLDDRARAGLIAAFEDPGDDVLPELVAADVADVLETVSSGGLVVGIVCDVGMTPSSVLRRYLTAHGLLEHFDHWSFSDEVGVYKPHERIFAHALGGLGDVDPSRAVHVGDLCRTDVQGARAVGMTAVRYRGANDDPPSTPETEGHHVIDTHTELLALLGL